MSHRRFLIAPSFARLIRKERGVAGRIVEGYLLTRADRDHFVSIEPDHAFLVLDTAAEGGRALERTEVPRSQAKALLEIAPGRVGYERTRLTLPGASLAFLDHFIAPGAVDLVTVPFGAGESPDAFAPPAWFGPEVTNQATYRTGSLALSGVPQPHDLPVSDASLGALLDLLERPGSEPQVSKAGDNADMSADIKGAWSEATASQPAAPSEGGQLDRVVAGLAEALEPSGLAGHPHGETDDTETDDTVIVTLERIEGRGRRS